MSLSKVIWQNIDYIYGLFSENKRQARKRYCEFIEKGIGMGIRPDLTGGGLLRSSGGWSVLKEYRKAGIRLKGDERVLGDSDFVENVLKFANESFEQKYELKARGYGFDRVKARVAEVMGLKNEDVIARDKSPKTVNARPLLCYWAHTKLGMTTIAIAKLLNMGQPAISRSSKRGEQIAKENKFELIEMRKA